MSALPEALPLALAAAIYPPALVVLLLLMAGERPRALVLAYFCGAALVTLGSGLIALELAGAANVTTEDSHAASGTVDIVIGIVLLVVAWFASRRRGRPAKPAAAAAAAEPEKQGRIAGWSHRATASRRWAFVLGCAMYLPSPLYLLAVKEIADVNGSPIAVVICAAAVLLFVEVPLIALYIVPEGVSGALQRFQNWLGRYGWTVVTVVALAAGIYAVIRGLVTL